MPANRPPDRAPYGSHLQQFLHKAAKTAAAVKHPPRDPNNPYPDGPLGGQPAKKPKGPKKPKDPNLNPNMAVPFGRR